MAKRGGGYKSEKRRKELTRLKKREEKKQKRLHKGNDVEQEPEGVATEEKEDSESTHPGDTNP